MDEAAILETLRNISHSLELLLRVKVQELRGDRSQKEIILLLDSLGCRSTEIVRILGTTPKTVDPILSRGRKTKRKR